MVEERSRRRRAGWPLLASLGLVALLAFISACGGGGAGSQGGKEEPAKEETQATVNNSEVASEETSQAGTDLGTPSLGDANAPVVMLEYADYQ